MKTSDFERLKDNYKIDFLHMCEKRSISMFSFLMALKVYREGDEHSILYFRFKHTDKRQEAGGDKDRRLSLHLRFFSALRIY